MCAMCAKIQKGKRAEHAERADKRYLLLSRGSWVDDSRGSVTQGSGA